MARKAEEVTSEIAIDRQRLIKRQFAKWRERRKPEYYEILEKRIKEYLTFCEETGMMPAVESCSLCIGISRTTFFRWRLGRGCSIIWQQAIESVYQVIQASVEQMGIEGRIQPLTMIWLQKNYGYKDGMSLETQAMTDDHYIESYVHPLEILRKYEALEAKESRSDAISAVKNVQQQAQPERIELSASADPWMDIPDYYGSPEDNEPFV